MVKIKDLLVKVAEKGRLLELVVGVASVEEGGGVGRVILKGGKSYVRRCFPQVTCMNYALTIALQTTNGEFISCCSHDAMWTAISGSKSVKLRSEAMSPTWNLTGRAELCCHVTAWELSDWRWAPHTDEFVEKDVGCA